VARKGHPRLSAEPTLKEFAAEKHVLVSTFGTGHAHQLAERAVEAAIPPENIICRVPIFIAAAIVAKRTDAVATLPYSMAVVLAEELGLDLVAAPIKLPKIEISQYWHERFHRDPGNEWVRSIFRKLFRQSARRAQNGAPDFNAAGKRALVSG
jgi:DNA-binding transcriptional LysR family regulator